MYEKIGDPSFEKTARKSQIPGRIGSGAIGAERSSS